MQCLWPGTDSRGEDEGTAPGKGSNPNKNVVDTEVLGLQFRGYDSLDCTVGIEAPSTCLTGDACGGRRFFANALFVAKPNYVQLPGVEPMPILYEDRGVLAIDKPAGWMLVPVSWQKTSRNLQAALLSSITGGDFWARSRNLTYLRYIHRLDGDTSGILLFAKNSGTLHAMGELFETRQMEKVYLSVTDRIPKETAWICRLSLLPDPKQYGRIIVNSEGKPAETAFRVLATAGGKALIEARPHTGRTHQIRVHLASAGCPVEGDELYGKASRHGLSLRAVGLAYHDPFTRRPVTITADFTKTFVSWGFMGEPYAVKFESVQPRSLRRPEPGAVPRSEVDPQPFPEAENVPVHKTAPTPKRVSGPKLVSKSKPKAQE